MKDLTSILQVRKSFVFNVWVNPDQLGALQQFASDIVVRFYLNCKMSVKILFTTNAIFTSLDL